MKRWVPVIALVTAFFPSISWAVTQNKPFQEYNYSKGLDSYHNPQSLPQGFVQDANNVLFDDKTPVDKRAGFVTSWSTKAYSYTGLWTYTDATNTTWQLARSSDQITANNLAGTTVLVATVSANNLVSEANAFGNAYFTDQTQGVYYWNGTSTTFVTPSPKGSIITQFHGRLWVTGAAVPNGNQLYGSGYFAGNTWTTGLNPTDPVQYSIGLQDNFDNITAEYVYLDTLYIFKHYAIFALYGFDQTSFQISQLTQECGCIDGGSIQTYNSGLKFMSLRGVENFNGYSCTRISDPIKNKVDPAIQVGGFNQQSWTQSQQTDWNAGTLNQLSAAISPPALVLSTQVAFVGTDNSQVNWDSGTLTNMDTTSYTPGLGVIISSSVVYDQGTGPSQSAGSPIANTPYFTFFQNLAQSFTTTSDPYQQLTNFGMTICQVGSPVTISPTLYSDNSGVPGSSLGVGGTVSDSGTGACTGSGTNVNINLTPTVLSPSTKYWIYVPIVGNSSNTAGWNPSNASYSGGNKWLSGSGNGSGSFTFSATINKGRISYNATTGAITSRVFDVGTTTNTWLFNWGTFNTVETDNGNTITYETQVSSSANGPWDVPVGVTPGGTIGSVPREFIQYIASFTTTNAPSVSPILSTVTFSTTALEKSSGTLKTQIHNLGTIGSFGNFAVSDLVNGGAIVFSICSSTNPTMSGGTGNTASCATQTPNTQILVSTGISGKNLYTQWYATFTVTNATQTPTLSAGSVQWYSGNPSIPMSSTIWDNRYWLSLTTNTFDSGNDAVLVLNKDNAWTSFDIHAGAFTQTKGNLYHSDSNATGNIYLDNQGFSDNGNPINSYIRTRTFGLGDFASDDYLYAMYPSALNTGTCPMSISYRMDGGGNTYSLGSPLLNEYGAATALRLPFPVDASHQDFGQSIDFLLGTNDGTCDWQFFGFEGLYKVRPVQ